jgi:hypothetical protein
MLNFLSPQTVMCNKLVLVLGHLFFAIVSCMAMDDETVRSICVSLYVCTYKCISSCCNYALTFSHIFWKNYQFSRVLDHVPILQYIFKEHNFT